MSIDLSLKSAEPLKRRARVLMRPESRQSEESLTHRAKAAAGRADDMGFFQKIVKEAPRRHPLRDLEPDIWRVNSAVRGVAHAGQALADETRVLHVVRDKALELGATDIINGKEQNTVDEVMRLTGGAGADLTIETAGTEITTRQAIHFAKRGSTIVLVGYSASGEETLPISLALDKELTFKTVFRYRHIYPLAIEAVSSGKVNLKGVVSNVWDFDDIENAMIQSVKDKANIVKSVIKIC